MSSRSFGRSVVQSPAASTENNVVSMQKSLSASLPTDYSANLAILHKPSTRTMPSAVSSKNLGDQVLHRRSRSNSLDSDPLPSRPDETTIKTHRQDSDQAKQSQVLRASYSESKWQSEKPIKGAPSTSLSQNNSIETTPTTVELQESHQKASVDARSNVSKQRTKQTLASPGPSLLALENRMKKSVGSSASFKRQASRNKVMDMETGKCTNGIRSEEIQYPSTPTTRTDDIFLEDGRQNVTPTSSNDSRGSALTDVSPDNMSSDRRRKVSSSHVVPQQSTPSSSSGSRDSPRFDDGAKLPPFEKRTKAQSSQVTSQQSTPSTSSYSRSSSRADDIPIHLTAEPVPKTPSTSHQQSGQSISSSSRSSSRTDDIHQYSSDRGSREMSTKVTTYSAANEDNEKANGKIDVVRAKPPSKDEHAIPTPRLKKEKSRGRIRNSENSARQVDDLIRQTTQIKGSSNVPDGKNQNSSARIKRNFINSISQDEFSLQEATRNSNERERLRTDSNVDSGRNPHVDTSVRRDRSARLNRKMEEGSKILQKDDAVALSQQIAIDEGPQNIQQIERSRSKKMVMKDVKPSRHRDVPSTDQPMKRSPSIKNSKGHSVNPDMNRNSLNTADPTHIPTTTPRKQATATSVTSSTKNPPTKQSSGRSNSSGGQKTKSGSQRKLTVKQVSEGGTSSSSGCSAQDVRLKETIKKQSDEITVASDPSLPNDNEDFVKLQAAAASRRGSQLSIIAVSKDNSRNEHRSKTHERKESLSKTAVSSSSDAPSIGRKEEMVSSSIKRSISNGRNSNRALESNRSSQRKNEKVSGQSIKNEAVSSTLRSEQVQKSEKFHAKNGVKNLNSIGNVGRTANGSGANRDGKPKDSTSLSSYLSDISVSTGADVTVASVQDSRNKELGSNVTNEKLKTSHLRRLVEPLQRRENVVRNSSHSSSALSSSGIRSSSSDQTETVADDRSISAEALFQAAKAPQQRGPRFPQRNSSFYRPKLFDSLNGPLKGDSAPVTPLRRLSMTGQYERQYSIASSSKCSVSYSGEESELEGAELSYSERIEEENEDWEESASSFSYANSTVTTMKPLDFDDLFTQFTWSISQQDPSRIQQARQRLRDNIIETPLFRAMEISRQSTQPTT